jgi:hypothetical protein
MTNCKVPTSKYLIHDDLHHLKSTDCCSETKVDNCWKPSRRPIEVYDFNTRRTYNRGLFNDTIQSNDWWSHYIDGTSDNLKIKEPSQITPRYKCATKIIKRDDTNAFDCETSCNSMESSCSMYVLENAICKHRICVDNS